VEDGLLEDSLEGEGLDGLLARVLGEQLDSALQVTLELFP
jgi:hypothetical protein